MDKFKFYTQADLLLLTSIRKGEQKLGEKVSIVPSLAALTSTAAPFVLLGIPEDIGVRANLGIAGTKTAWPAALKALLNTQSNPFLTGDELIVLGHFEFEETVSTDLADLGQRVEKIDELVAPVIEAIIAAGKTPIIIGGGHNNAYPIIAGTAKALAQKINVVNIDAHADLRSTAERRHSGNGFSFALAANFLAQYRIFGLHQNYCHQELMLKINENPQLAAFYFEDLLKSSESVYHNWTNFVADLPSPCGLEIDLDSIANLLSSAVSPTGFSLNQLRTILLNPTKNFNYLHICEGAAALSDGRVDATTGKAIAYLITDFIKALPPRTYQQPSA